MIATLGYRGLNIGILLYLRMTELIDTARAQGVSVTWDEKRNHLLSTTYYNLKFKGTEAQIRDIYHTLKEWGS